MNNSRRSRIDPFIERSIMSALNFLKDAVFSDEVARSRGFLQRLDPRIKILGCLVSVLAVSFVRSPLALAGLYIFSVILASASGINIGFFIKRVWIFIPLFALAIAIPAVFTDSLYSAVVFVLRVAASVSFVVLLTVTTPHARLINSLRKIGLPAIFVQVLDMTYRYIFLFITVFQDMHMALKARVVRRPSGYTARSWVAGRIGHMFTRSVKMSEEVYLSMIARGYTIGKTNGK